MIPGATRTVAVERRDGAARASGSDEVVIEEPLAIRVAGETLAVTMRTPGLDRELALGFLWAEGVIAALEDVGGVAHCVRLDDEAGRGNTIEVTPAPGARLRLPEGEAGRRGTLTTSACGVCGRRSIDDLLARCGPLGDATTVSASIVRQAVATLRETQPVFERTGGCHGAALFDAAGAHVLTCEDVGRHNAVDKLVGARLLAGGIPARGHLLVVSGRTSFEIVQKAIAAGIPVVAGISAPSSLAVALAQDAGVLLVGFVRGERLVAYAHAERLTA